MNKLCISDLRLWLHLGCSPEEQHHPQPVRIDLQLDFPFTPAGVKTDNLKEACCYREIVELIKRVCTNRHFHLIEYVAGTLYESIQKDLLSQHPFYVDLQVTVTKLAPPVPEVHGGVSFTYSGFISHETP